MSTPTLKSPWTAAVGDTVITYSAKAYKAQGTITELLSGGRANVRLLNGQVITCCIPDLEIR